MTQFVVWLVDNGRRVRLFTSDTADEPVVRRILDDVRAQRPGLDPSRVIAEPVPSLDELMRQTAAVDTVVAARYHNVLYALKMGKPTVSLGYAAKHDVLMADMGMSEFSQPVKSLDVQRLIEQFTELESRSAQLRVMITERNEAKSRLVKDQFAELAALLFTAAAKPGPEPDNKPVRTGSRR
jgi:polysaccharide pyruvyl transferase WcaK-like protein